MSPQISSASETGLICDDSKNEENFKKVKRRKLGADKEMMHAFLSSSEFLSSRLRPRKEMPALKIRTSKKKNSKGPEQEMLDFKMVDMCGVDGPSIIGRKVEVYWPDSRRWFKGRVKAFDHQKMVHKIDYYDGDKEHLDMTKELFRMEVFPGEIYNIKPDCNTNSKPKHPNDEAAGKLQKGHDVENRLVLQHNNSGDAFSCPQSLSQRGMADVYESLTDESLVETCPESEDNMVGMGKD